MIQSKAVLTVNAIAKKLSANDVLAFLHRVVVIDNRNLSVVYRSSSFAGRARRVIDNRNLSVVYRGLEYFALEVNVIDNRNLSVVYRGILEDFLESAVIDTGNSSVVYRFQNKVAISFKIWYKKYMILFCRIS